MLLQSCNLELLDLLLTVTRKRLDRICSQIPDPSAQHVLVQVQIPRCLRHEFLLVKPNGAVAGATTTLTRTLTTAVVPGLIRS